MTWLDQRASFEDRLVEMLAGDDEAEKRHRPMPSPPSPRRPTALLARVLGEVSAIMAGPSIQVRCLDCPPGAGRRAVDREAVAWWSCSAA